MVDPNGRLQRLVAQVLLIVDAHPADEGFGLAGIVVGDLKILQLDGERQLLQQIAIAQAQKHEIGGRAFRQHHITPKRGHRSRLEPAGRRDVARRQVAAFDRELAVPFLELQPQVAIQQAPDADHHHCGVGEQVAQAVVATLHGRHDLMAGIGLHAPAIAEGPKNGGDRRQRFFRLRAGQRPFGLLVKTPQGMELNPGAKPQHFPQHDGHLPVQTNGGGQNQEGENAQKPVRPVHVVKPQPPKHLEPEGSELEHVVGIGLVLLEDRADGRGHGDHHQQRDGQIHRTQEFQQHPFQGTPRNDAVGSDFVHSEVRERGRTFFLTRPAEKRSSPVDRKKGLPQKRVTALATLTYREADSARLAGAYCNPCT